MTSSQDPLAPEPEPWLLFYHKNIAGQIFYNISEDCYYDVSIPDMHEKEICTSSHGWMVILDTEQEQCFLLNPFSLEKIHLPPYYDWKSFKYTECMLSSHPDDPNCTVLFVIRDEFRIMYCQLRDRWYILNFPRDADNYYSPVSCNGATYTLLGGDLLFMVKLHTFPYEIEILPTRPLFHSDSIGADLVALPHFELVGSHNELFLVLKYHLTRKRNTMVWSFQIFKMDFSTMEWERVRNLGNKALFLGPDVKGVLYSGNGGSRILSNSIYFTQEEDSYLYRFDIKEKSISATLPCPHLADDLVNSMWVMPDAKSALEIPHMFQVHMQGQNKVLHQKELEEEKKIEDLPVQMQGQNMALQWKELFEERKIEDLSVQMQGQNKALHCKELFEERKIEDLPVQMQGQNKALDWKEHEEEKKKEDLRILPKVVTKSTLGRTVGALLSLLLAFVKEHEMLLGPVFAAASISAPLGMMGHL